MRKIYLNYLVIISSVMVIFFLYNRNYKLSGEIIKSEDVVVFYQLNNEIVGCKLDSYDDEIIEIFDYLTIKRNSSPSSFISPNIYIELLNYEVNNKAITLYVSKNYLNLDNSILNSFITLLYESYHILGYDELTISCNDLYYTYNKEDIFKFNIYKNYKKKSNEGYISYLYYINGDYINFESVLYDFDDEISYKMQKLYPDIEYEVYSNNIKIYYNSLNVDYDDLLKSLQYNFNGYDFTLIKV